MGPQDKGQTLVEVALILPLLLIAIVVFAQVWCFCHNACALQDGVSRVVRQAALGERSDLTNLSAKRELLQELRGQTTRPSFRLERRMIQPWRPFPGYATMKTPGYLASMQGSVIQWKRGWGLPPLRIRAFAEIPKEPPVPEDQ